MLYKIKFMLLLVLGSVILKSSLLYAQPTQDDLKPLMQQVFSSITYLISTSEVLTGGVESGNHQQTLAHLQRLNTVAEEIEMHTSASQNRALWLNSRSFSDALGKLERAYQRGDPDYMRFYVLNITESCFACHSRQASNSTFALGEQLLGDLQDSALDVNELALLQVAVRQFDAALETWESYLLDPFGPTGSYEYADAITEYLFLSINVFDDFDRPLKTLDAMLEQVHLPGYLVRQVETWKDQLDELRDSHEFTALGDIQDLYSSSNDLSEIPFDRSRLVFDIVVRSLLENYLNRPQNIIPEDLSDIYFMLGVIEYRLERGAISIPQAELYFEAAIRANPAGSTARKAFDVLEENSGYAVSTNFFEAPELPVPLNELRELIDMSSE
ncbi:MAG: hypothetical protein HOM55_00305 [Proteobacteria bacterium]|jgi:tetratricopeptide (TPR) repeat protein|nr:hypothetical protein [Pseudomonadota bacterium]